MKLLIIEDEKELSDSIVSYLGKEDYLCEQAFTFDEAMMKVGHYHHPRLLPPERTCQYQGDYWRSAHYGRKLVHVVEIKAKDPDQESKGLKNV